MDGSHVLTESHQLAVKDDRRAVGSLPERQEASGTRSCDSPPIFISPFLLNTRAARAYHFTRPPIFLMTDKEIDMKARQMNDAATARGEKIVIYVTHREHCLIGKEGQCNCRHLFEEVSAGELNAIR